MRHLPPPHHGSGAGDPQNAASPGLVPLFQGQGSVIANLIMQLLHLALAHGKFGIYHHFLFLLALSSPAGMQTAPSNSFMCTEETQFIQTIFSYPVCPCWRCRVTQPRIARLSLGAHCAHEVGSWGPPGARVQLQVSSQGSSVSARST